MKFKVSVIAVSILALLTPMAVVPVSAQDSSGASTQNGSATPIANSLRIAPVRTELAMDPGSSKQVTVYAQNLSPTPVQVRAVVSDFEPSRDETGNPLVILDDQYAKSHSLKRLSSVEPAVLTLPGNTRVGTTVTVTVPKNARAGGYYGAVRFLPADANSIDGNGVAISANVASLLLLKVNGDIEEKMTLASMDVRQNNKPNNFFKSNKDLRAVIRFNNEGNVQVQPFGKILLKDRSGKIVEEHEVNNTDPRGNVLPESIRRFEIDLKKVSSFGKYTLEGNFGYGTGGSLITSKTSFWVVPTTYMIAAGAALLIIGLIIFLIVKVMRLSGRRRTYGRRY